MLKKLNNLFNKWWFIILYTAMWSVIFYAPFWMVVNKKHNK